MFSASAGRERQEPAPLDGLISHFCRIYVPSQAQPEAAKRPHLQTGQGESTLLASFKKTDYVRSTPGST